jgi:uncharacterized membrane protein YkoI
MADRRAHLKPAALYGWLCIALALGWVAPVGSDEVDHDEALWLAEQGRIQPLRVMIDDALRRFPGRFLEAELERDDGRYIYELEIVTRDRRVIELEYDAATGTLLDVDIDEDD